MNDVEQKNLSVFRTLSLTTLILTVCMITLGGVVHNTGSSLACPDWPLCFGQVFPKMEGAVAIEHSHRLLGATIGLLCICLCVGAARHRGRSSLLFRGCLVALGLVIFQGVLGGVTVLMQLSPLVSTAHLATSQVFLATLLWINFKARKVQDANMPAEIPSNLLGGVKLALIFVFLQMLLGAAIRHGGASVACGLGSQAMFLCIDPMTASRTLWPTLHPAQLNMIHRFGALAAGAAVIGGTLPLMKWAKKQKLKALKLLCVAGHAIWSFQVILGLLTIYNYIGVVSVTLHLVFAVFLWMTLCSLYYYASGVHE